VNYGIWNVALFSTYTVPGRFILSGSAGISGIKTDDGESAGPNFFTATSLTYQFAQAVATLAVSNGFSETFSSGQNFGITETLTTSASLSYPFTPLVSGSLRGFFTRNETVGSLAGTRGETDENWGGTLAFTYRIRSNIAFDLAYTYRRHKGSNSSQGSNVDDKYSENRVRAALSLSF
jgi:hypothetical protein